MKKLLIVNLGRKGAGPVYSLEMAKALEKLGEYKIKALISKKCDNYDAWAKSEIDLISIDTFESNKEFVLATLNILKFIKLHKIIKCFSPDYVYIPMIHWWNPIINFISGKAKIIFTVHDVIQHKGEESLLADTLRKITLRQSDKVIILSESLREKLVKQGVERSKIFVIPHANFTYYGEEFDIGTKKYDYNRILFFGRINKYKGLDVLLEAMKKIVEINPNLVLNIVGNGDISEYHEDFKLLEKNLELNVRWIKDEEVAEFFIQSDLVVVPYIEASQSGVIPLAYSFGLPVIATRIGGIPEQVEEGETGYLIEPNNVEELVNSIVKLSGDLSLKEELGKNAYKYAKEKLTWEGSGRLFEILVKNL